MRALRVMVVIGLMTLVGGALTAGSAGAQDGGSITVEQTHPTGTGAHYFVRVAGATDATTVTATATGPDGEAGDPVTLDSGGEEGLYQGGVEMPTDGTWTVTFTAKSPDATLEHTQKVPVDAETDGGSSGSGSGSSGSSEDDEPSPTVPLIFAGLFVLALIAMGIWALVERGKQPAGSTTTEDADDTAGAADDDEASVTTTSE